jgi:hypothetical protein
MLQRTLCLLLLVLSQTSFFIYDEDRTYQPIPFQPKIVESYERLKRELLQIEDTKVGDGPIAAAGRRVAAEITVRYSDGTLVYEGPAVTYWGIIGDTFIHNSPREPYMMSLDQTGIVLGF